ncbi:MAG: hypothetical protein R2744_01400 [Bacteroidales bacterium]
MQRNWIGRSVGAEVEFAIEGVEETLTVFTTRPDTIRSNLYGYCTRTSAYRKNNQPRAEKRG